MQKIEKNRLSSMEAVYRFCQQYPSVWAILVAFAGAISGLGIKIQAIISIQALQEANNTGVAVNKSQLKEAMINIASIVAYSIQSYAKNINDMILFNKLSMSPSALLRGKDADAIATCRLIYDLVNAISLDARTPYGVSDESLKLLKDSTDAFETDAPATRNVKSDKTAYTKQIKKLVGEGNDIMRNDILKLGRQFINTNPDFYNGLRSSARLITSDTHTKIRLVVLDDVTQLPLEGVTASVDGTTLTATTNAKGKCNIYIADGIYNVKLSKANYMSMDLSADVKRGSNTVNVQMSPAFNIPAAVETKKENA